MSRRIIIEHEGKTYYARSATITSTSLGAEDHGILTAYLMVEGDGWGVGVGGFALDTYSEQEKRRVPTAYGFDHIMQLCRTVGVETWESLPGKSVLVLFERENSWGTSPQGIAHIQDEKRVFVMSDHADGWKSGVAVYAEVEG